MSRLVARRRSLGIPGPISLFQGLNGQSPEVFTESVPHQRRAITLGPEGRAVRCLQQFLIENHVNSLQLPILFPYSPESGGGL